MQHPYLLIGDIGGTHARLRLLEQSASGLALVQEHTFPSASYPSFEAVLEQFLAQDQVKVAVGKIGAACFSVAGLVENGVTTLTNLGWRLDETSLAQHFGISHFELINDFAAAGYGIGQLRSEDILTLQEGNVQPQGTRLVIGAGTGLGVCVLNRQNRSYVVHASEGGHMDFAPVNSVQDALLAHVREAFGHVSYERLVSGPGLLRIFYYLQDSGAGMASKELMEAMSKSDAAAISEAALNKTDPVARKALDLFIEIYGSFAGNLALATLAHGGVYIAGGIARQITGKLTDGSFVQAFADKGRFADFLRSVPVHVVLNEKVGLLGAGFLAARANSAAA